MLRRVYLNLFTLFCFIYTSTVIAFNIPSFESPEHLIIGDKVLLRFSQNDGGKAGLPLHLPNGLMVTYGEVITFGDFYEIPNQPIADGQTAAEQQARFLAAYASFALNPNAPNEANQLLAVIHNEKKLVDDAILQGQDPEAVYVQLYNETAREFNCITGGGCHASNWWLFPGRYLSLQKTNYDHFGEKALIAYQTGHEIAIKTAVVAHQTGDSRSLESAYAMNAFACHFLTDIFAPGHIRTPRFELATKVNPSLIGSLLSNYMHNEENHFGIRVHNRRGDHWIAFGDKLYLDQRNERNRAIVDEVMQHSVDEIFNAYTQGETQSDNTVIELLPIPDEMNNAANLDISPLFYWDNDTQKVMRRADMTNYYDRHWIADWNAYVTLTQIIHERGLPGPR